MQHLQLRRAFLDFFSQRSHHIEKSAALVPQNDASLLLINAGMVPFKEFFLGTQTAPWSRATSIQKCVRAGGKHNDLQNVGYTPRHHTFFEMMGNFSFGDYFKTQAIEWAWAFLTEVLKLDPQRLWITVFEEDLETHQIWLQKIGIPEAQVSFSGAVDNFWSMGETGPCGPCTEIYYDNGPSFAGDPPGNGRDPQTRFVEIWNLVFMQYNRLASGELVPLPQPSVDTGMGLERICAVLQGVSDNYQTDLFLPIISHITTLCPQANVHTPGVKVIADHLRSYCFLAADGVFPSNEGRGYVLRRLARRALRYAHKLQLSNVDLLAILSTVAKVQEPVYPELMQLLPKIQSSFLEEAEQFQRTLQNGLQLLEQHFSTHNLQKIDGSLAFKLHDTYGFPLELTMDLAKERGLDVDQEAFAKYLDEQRKRSQAQKKIRPTLVLDGVTEFKGYETLNSHSTIEHLYVDQLAVSELQEGQRGCVILTQTSFYPEGGGQIGDQGQLLTDHAVFEVENTIRYGQSIAHEGWLKKGQLKLQQAIRAQVDAPKRQATAIHHSATHLLHAALRQILGEHVQQKGSLVTPDRLRFDFNFHRPLTASECSAIESWVNERIFEKLAANIQTMPLSQAQAEGVLSLFGEKYAQEVRVVRFGGASGELCGGTHVSNTGDLGMFKIIQESGIGNGIRRLEAVAGSSALNWIQGRLKIIEELSATCKTDAEGLLERFQSQQVHYKALGMQLKQVELCYFSEILRSFSPASKRVVHKLCLKEINHLKNFVEQARLACPKAFICAYAEFDGALAWFLSSPENVDPSYNALNTNKEICLAFNGKGGGKTNFAQGQGQSTPQWEEFFRVLWNSIESKV